MIQDPRLDGAIATGVWHPDGGAGAADVPGGLILEAMAQLVGQALHVWDDGRWLLAGVDRYDALRARWGRPIVISCREVRRARGVAVVEALATQDDRIAAAGTLLMARLAMSGSRLGS